MIFVRVGCFEVEATERSTARSDTYTSNLVALAHSSGERLAGHSYTDIMMQVGAWQWKLSDLCSCPHGVWLVKLILRAIIAHTCHTYTKLELPVRVPVIV